MRRALLLVLISFASPALADVGPNGPHREGDYGGVVPGAKPDPSARPGRIKRLPRRGTLSWIGFEAKDGGAQLFFQSVAPFELTQRVEGGSLIVHLSLGRLGPNTWRQIDTRFFDNPIAGMVARQVRAARATKLRPAQRSGIDVNIAFKNPKDAREGALRSQAEADGMHYVYLTFPEGTDATPPAITEPEK